MRRICASTGCSDAFVRAQAWLKRSASDSMPFIVMTRTRDEYLTLRLMHWHYDAWVVADDGRFYIHTAHPFDATCLLQFEPATDGAIVSFSIPFESAVAPIRFARSR